MSKRIIVVPLNSEQRREIRWSESFVRDHAVEERKRMTESKVTQNLVPVILDRMPNGDLDLKNHKCITVSRMTCAEFIAHIRAEFSKSKQDDPRISISEMDGLHFLMKTKDGTLIQVTGHRTMGEVQRECAQPDGFLYWYFAKEETFGGKEQ